MRIAVTGATGFVGRHVLAELARRGIDTVACARPGSDEPQPALAGRQWVEIDIGAPGSEPFEHMHRPDALIHLAWAGLPNYRALHHFESELPRQYVFLSQALRDGLARLVVAGTCFEYGMQSGAIGEAAEPRPDNPYGFAKNALRHQLQFLRTERDFALSWGRMFYVYGEGQAENALFPSLRRAVERGDETFRMSGGEQLRDFLPVEAAAVQLVDAALNINGMGIFNICSGQPRSVRAQVEAWLAENGWTIPLELGHYPYADYEPHAFWGVVRNSDKLES